MNWRIEFASAAERDFSLILDHLVESYVSFGDSPAEANVRAGRRLLAILEDSHRIMTAPHRGNRHDDMLPGLRQLTLGKATFWFIAEDATGLIRILSVFFGAQDQQRRMLVRLLERPHDH